MIRWDLFCIINRRMSLFRVSLSTPVPWLRRAGGLSARVPAARFWGRMMSEQDSAKGRNRGGVQRVEGKLRASVERGDYYEAHQMYRTLFFRWDWEKGLQAARLSTFSRSFSLSEKLCLVLFPHWPTWPLSPASWTLRCRWLDHWGDNLSMLLALAFR